MKFSVISIALFAGLGVATPMIFDKRTSCQLGSIGPANAGNAACSASVSLKLKGIWLLGYVPGTNWCSATFSMGIFTVDTVMRMRKLTSVLEER